NVRNYLSVTPRRLLPFLKGAECTYQYAERVPIDYIRIESGAEAHELENAAEYSELAMSISDPLPPDSPRAMYLAFDAPPEAMPLAVRFSIAGDAALGSKIVYEALSGDGFKPLRVSDGTSNFRRSGCVFMYIPEPLSNARLFGRDAYWLRMSLSGGLMPPRWNAPRVLGIDLNTVRAVQKQFASERVFSSSGLGETRVLELPDNPIIDCEIFVNETQSKDAEASARWTPWNKAEALFAEDAEARVYELDRDAGTILFGDGIHGKSLPSGELNIRVRYSYGGGARGNMNEGEVNAFVGSIPRISGITNITPMSGGTDKISAARTEELSRRRFRHRGVALGASDFEEMTLERFPRVVHARCFRNTDGYGKPVPGHVCLAIMGVGEMLEDAAATLCADVYEYLSTRCDANLITGGRLHIVHSTEVTLNVQVSITLENPDFAAETQQLVSERISRLVNEIWRARGIDDQADLNELHFAVRSAPNVTSVLHLMPEGKYRSGGRLRTILLDKGETPPFMTIRNGLHTVKVG
ncbi:MAG: baseplate J/gp47 family protein, partial [Oscillospiraceae bacterium]|nr:baseplate J/gp47 family protein [Oscillospiraceae bacterium]